MKIGLMTKAQALSLGYGDHIYDKYGAEYKVNGKPQIYFTMTSKGRKKTGEWRVPIKYGLYDYGYISAENLDIFLKPHSVSYHDITHKKHERQMNKDRQIRYAGKIYKVKF